MRRARFDDRGAPLFSLLATDYCLLSTVSQKMKLNWAKAATSNGWGPVTGRPAPAVRQARLKKVRWTPPVKRRASGTPTGWLLIKIFLIVTLFLWFRATFPRYRYDQIMRLGWKVFLPFSLLWLVLTAGVLTATGELPVR